jgi:hypothetical protein
MIDPTNAAAAVGTSRLTHPNTSAPRAAAPRSSASFAGQLARFVSTADNTVKAVARPDNEQTTKVSGHPYSRIENGADKGLYLNQLAGSPREGAVFKLVRRDDRVFHVYGTGKERVIVEVKHTTAPAYPTPPTGGTSPATGVTTPTTT